MQPYTATKSYESTLKIVNTAKSKAKEKPPATRPYQGILLDREGLKRYLEALFTSYGMEREIPIAEDVIQCESGWLWYADNGISKGLAQFTPATWQDYCSGDYNAMNPQEQLTCMAKMWSVYHLQSRWDCYQKLAP